MTTAQPQRRSGRPRWRPQFTLGWLIAFIVVANLYFAYFLYEPAKWDRVHVHVAADLVTVGSRKASWHELPAVLRQCTDRIREAGFTVSSTTVRMTVDDGARYQDFLRTVTACLRSGMGQVLIRPDEHTDWFHLPSRNMLESSLSEVVSAYVIDLTADSAGRLERIATRTGNRTLSTPRAEVTALAWLRKGVLGFVGPETGPNSLREHVKIELIADGHLRFKHVATMLRALTEESQQGSERVPLIRRLRLFLPDGDDPFENLVTPPTVPQLSLGSVRDAMAVPSGEFSRAPFYPWDRDASVPPPGHLLWFGESQDMQSRNGPAIAG